MTIDVPALIARGERIGEARNLTKAEVLRVAHEGRALVVKTLATRPALARNAFARMLLAREARALAALAGTPGVPRLLASTSTTLVVEEMPGRTLHERRWVGIDEGTAARLSAVVAAVHERGYAHGDLGRNDVIVADDGSVGIVDFATAVGPGMPRLLWRLLLPYWRRRDCARVAKMVRRYRAMWDRRVATSAAPVSA